MKEWGTEKEWSLDRPRQRELLENGKQYDMPRTIDKIDRNPGSKSNTAFHILNLNPEQYQAI